MSGELVTLAFASLVAGLAITPYAAFTSSGDAVWPACQAAAVVIPAGMLGLVAMPFGFTVMPKLAPHPQR